MPNLGEVRGFLGLLVTSELKMHLKQSSVWQRAKSSGENRLWEANYEGSEYLGLPLSFPLKFTQLKELEEQLKLALQEYCPKLNILGHKIYLFTQLFIS